MEMSSMERCTECRRILTFLSFTSAILSENGLTSLSTSTQYLFHFKYDSRNPAIIQLHAYLSPRVRYAHLMQKLSLTRLSYIYLDYDKVSLRMKYQHHQLERTLKLPAWFPRKLVRIKNFRILAGCFSTMQTPSPDLPRWMLWWPSLCWRIYTSIFHPFSFSWWPIP